MPSELHQIPLRVDDDLFERIEKHIERLRKDTPGIEFTRTGAVLNLIARGLEVVEKVRR